MGSNYGRAHMPWPTFVIAGTVRGATTSLHYYLEQHPQIAMSSIKEPNYFLFDAGGVPTLADPGIITKSVRSEEKYQALFPADARITARGDASPLYLYTRQSPALIAAAVPDARVVAVLRDPVKRA